MTGTVSMLLVELGERVAGTNLMAGTELMRVADLSRMEAQVQVMKMTSQELNSEIPL